MKPSKKVTIIGRSAPDMVFSMRCPRLPSVSNQVKRPDASRALGLRRRFSRNLGKRGLAPGCGLGGDGILFEKFGDQSRVEISSNSHDLVDLEKEDPTVTIVESHAVPCRRQGMELDHRLVAFDDEIFQVELSSLRKHFAQFGKGTGDKVRLAAIATGERMSTHHGPIDVVSDMYEKGGSVALLQTFEYFTNEVRCNSHLISPSRSVYWSTLCHCGDQSFGSAAICCLPKEFTQKPWETLVSCCKMPFVIVSGSNSQSLSG